MNGQHSNGAHHGDGEGDASPGGTHHYATSAPVIATLPPSSSLVVFVNPESASCRIAQEASKRGHRLAALWTSSFAGETQEKVQKRDPSRHGCPGLRYDVELEEGRDWRWVQSNDELDRERKVGGGFDAIASVVRGAASARGLEVAACLPGNGGAKAGVLADQLASRLGSRTCLAAPPPPATTAPPSSPDASSPRSIASATMTSRDEISRRGKDVRNKHAQQVLLRAAGLRSVRQVCASSVLDSAVTDFLDAERYPVVVKPASRGDEDDASEGIKLCRSKSEAVEHFERLVGEAREARGSDREVLCQEYLRGTELIVDHASRDGVHKTCAVWKHEKRPANGADGVHFAARLVDSLSFEAVAAVPYVRRCLDALGAINGPTHAEVVLTTGGPVLVYLALRAHGGDGSRSRLARALTGRSQVEASVDAVLDREAFEKIPDAPRGPFKAHGLLAMLVSYSEGEVASTLGFEVLRRLPSFVSLSSSAAVGSRVEYTIDLATSPGACLLVNKDEEALDKDLAFLRHLEEINGLFAYKTRAEGLARPTARTYGAPPVSPAKRRGGGGHRRVASDFPARPSLLRIASNDRPDLAAQSLMSKRMTTVDASKECVVVTDPYSTGCLVVNEMLARGYNVVALWTKGFSEEMKSHTPLAAGKMTYRAEVDEGETLADTAREVYRAAGALRVVACLAGGEAGVDCADALSERMGLRSNGTGVANRRDKKVQQEMIRDVGMRAVRQAAGRKWSDVEEFLQSERYPVVLKPTDSAGSDGVKLCHNIEEAKEHFHHLFQVEAVNGGFNEEVLCQEFLRGKEYVIDQVSREGVHKTTMVWVYDKRPANNSAFVYFGMVPVDPTSAEARILVPYARRVLDVLGVRNGPSHAEVIVTPSGPCLVEMNVRAHGGDGNWRSLARGLTGGYSQVEVAVDAYLDKRRFAAVPDLPPCPFKASGQEVILVSFSRGRVAATPGYDVIRGLPSFVYMETGIKVGSYVERTVDLLTGIGSVILMHNDADMLENDVARIREIERNNELFVYERPGAMFSAVSQRHLSEIIVDEHEGNEY